MASAGGSDVAAVAVEDAFMSSDFAGGCVGGAAGVLVGQPLDVVIVRMQTAAQPFTSMRECIRYIRTRDGLRGFYRGVIPPIISFGFDFLSVITPPVFQSTCIHAAPSTRSFLAHMEPRRAYLALRTTGCTHKPTTILNSPVSRSCLHREWWQALCRRSPPPPWNSSSAGHRLT